MLFPHIDMHRWCIQHSLKICYILPDPHKRRSDAALSRSELTQVSSNVHRRYCTQQRSFSNSAPGFSSSAPGLSNSAPGFRTSAPGFRASAPGLRTSAPGLSTSAPGLSNSAPGFSSSAPGLRTSAPCFRTSAPGFIAPGEDRRLPGSPASQPDSEDVHPSHTADSLRSLAMPPAPALAPPECRHPQTTVDSNASSVAHGSAVGFLRSAGVIAALLTSSVVSGIRG